MNPQDQQQAPRWLQRSEARQAFVATLCSAVNLDDSVSIFYDEVGSLPILGADSYGANSCSITIECLPLEAWALLRSLRERLSRADVYLQPRNSAAIRLLICDMDMTIVAAETLDEVAALLGLGDRIAAITTRAMNGEIDFDDALRARIAMLKGQPVQVFHDIVYQLELNPGAAELLAAARAAGVYCVLISGGFAQVAESIAHQLGFDEVYCNHLDVIDGRLTGEVQAPIVNADYKCNVLQRVAQAQGFSLDECCAIGDGANDLPMIRAAGLGIAYHGKPVLGASSACLIDATDLSSAIQFMRLGASPD